MIAHNGGQHIVPVREDIGADDNRLPDTSLGREPPPVDLGTDVLDDDTA